MPSYIVSQPVRRSKIADRAWKNSDPEYVTRLREVLLKDQRQGDYMRSRAYGVERSYIEHHPSSEEDEQEPIVYQVVKQKRVSKRNKSDDIILPRIKKKKRAPSLKESINRNQLDLIRNYMNANLVPYRTPNNKIHHRRHATMQPEDYGHEVSPRARKNKKQYMTPISLIEPNTNSDEISSRTQINDESPDRSLAKSLKKSRVLAKRQSLSKAPPQYFSSAFIEKPSEISHTTDRQSPSKDHFGRDKSNNKNWSEINPLLLETYFVKVKRKQNQSPSPKKAKTKRVLPLIPQKIDIPKFIRNYIPECDDIKIEELIKSEKFQIVTNEGSPAKELYFGEVVNGARHGKGVIIKQAFVFEGVWEQGKKLKGVQMTEVGMYKGTFKDNRRNGKGQFFWAHGEYFSGQWKNGKKHGSGYWKADKGESYMGEWNNGQVSGYGVHNMKTGQRYEGQFQKFLKHGFGKEQFPNGDVYEGNYVQGRAQGHGKYSWKCGAVFSGEFMEGEREGPGKIVWENVMSFEGSFRKDLACGQGRAKYSNGNEFSGNYEKGRRQGIGILNLRKGRQVVKGRWVEDSLAEEI